MNNYLNIGLTGILIILCTAFSQAQTLTVTGEVLDNETLEPLPGVNILESNTTNGTVTDINGQYTITVSEDATLIFSYIGYQSQSILVASQTKINIELAVDSKNLDEVVIIGYGSTSRQKITGAVTSVSPDDFKSGPITTVEEALQGNAAGLMIQNNGGQPGAAARINIRGVNSLTGSTQPLIVVDGFPLFDVNTSGGGGLEDFSSQMSPLAFINPSDIKSIEILKDASATAIYGNRGANGVILITTNKGAQPGVKATYSTYYGVRKLSKKIDVLNFKDYAQYQNQINPGNRLFTDPSTNELYDFDYEDIPSVDWQDELYRTGLVKNHSFSLQNSSEKANTYFSLATLNDKSILIESDFKKYNAKLGFEQTHNKKLSFGGDLSFNYIDYQGVPTEGRAGTATAATMQALLAAPFDLTNPKTYKEFVEDAFVSQIDADNYIEFDRSNPIVQARDTDLKKTSNRFIANAFTSYNITEDLSLRISGAADMYNLKGRQFYPSTTGTGLLFDGLAVITDVRSINLLNENILTYRKLFRSKHDINLTAGYTQQQNDYEFLYTEGTSFENESLGYNQLSAASSLRSRSDVDKLRLESYLVRSIYTYDSKLSISLSARLDGTSRFINDKWGDFYSVGVSYDLTKDIIANSQILTGLKLRASYGQVGNSNVSTQGAFAQLRQTNYTFDDQEVSGLSASNLANESLTWESTNEINYGVDFILGKSKRLIGTIDYYVKETNNLILETPIPNISGFNTAFQNVGSISNSGIELSLQSNIIYTTDFSWDVGVNFTHLKSKVLELGQNGAPIYIDPFFEDAYTNEFILREGGEIGEIFGFESAGIYKNSDFDANGQLLPGVVRGLSTAQPGDLKLKDQNGDGEITDDDRTVLGNTMPKYFGGLSNTVKFRNFELRVMLQYYFDYSVFNASKTRYARYTGGADNISSDWVDRWTPENQSDIYSRIPNTVVVDQYVEDASFLRVSNIKLGYTLPPKYLNLGANSLNFYVSIDNALIFTKYSGYDPEVSTNHSDRSKSSAVSSGIDYGSFPRARTYIAGLTLTF